MDETTIRAMIKDHFDWASKDEVRASKIYAEDAVLEFPQSGERIRSRANIIAFRTAYPASVTFEMHRTIGRDDLWVNEYTIRYNGERPHKVVGIMEFRNGHVVRERIYINEPGSLRLGGPNGSNELPTRRDFGLCRLRMRGEVIFVSYSSRVEARSDPDPRASLPEDPRVRQAQSRRHRQRGLRPAFQVL